MMIPIARPLIEENEKQAVIDVLDSGMIAAGEYVNKFEAQFAKYINSRYGIACSSGTTALDVALKAAGIKKGDKVLTTPFTFIASSNAILYSGAEPVFTDIEADTFNISPDAIRKKLKEELDIKALLIVHLYGLSCNMDEIMKIVDEYDLILIEDCAQAHGAEYRGKKAGTFGDVSTFSFYPTKNITTGEGGMVLTDNEKIYKKAKLLINHGSQERYNHEVLGYNYRMTNIAAAIGLSQLEKLNDFNQKRQRNAAFFTENLKDISWLETPVVPEGYKHVFHQYTIKINKNRDDFADYLKNNGIGYGIHYPLTVNKQPLYKKLGYEKEEYRVAEEMSSKVISIPVHPALNESELNKIVDVIGNYTE